MKIAVCTPVHSSPKLDFVYCLFRAIKSASGEHEVEWFPLRSTNLPGARCELARMAAEWGADRILWADDDHTFPADTIERLCSHNAQAVGANYLRREVEPRPTACLVKNGRTEPVWTDAESPGLERVHGLGLGLCMVDTAILPELRQPLFQGATEDSFFFGSLLQAGVPVFCDHALSLEVGHIGETVLRFPAHRRDNGIDTAVPSAGDQQGR